MFTFVYFRIQAEGGLKLLLLTAEFLLPQQRRYFYFEGYTGTEHGLLFIIYQMHFQGKKTCLLYLNNF